MAEAAALAAQIEAKLGLRDSQIVQQLAAVSQTVDQARQYAGLPDASGNREKWREMFSEESQRVYFADTASPATSWDPPPYFRFADWQLDAATYGISIEAAKSLFEAAHWLQAENTGGAWRRPAALLTKALANVVDCGNSEARYRKLPLSNDTVRANLFEVLAARQLLEAAGFQATADCMQLAADTPLGPLQAALARLRRLADNKGHSGEAEFFPLPSKAASAGGSRPSGASPLLGTPGYRHQQVIYHCSVCDHGINDGSERLFTGLHSAPKGEFRYECTSCEGFNLCEACWDKLQAGALSHDGGHNWQHHHPRAQRHNTQHAAGAPGASPWGLAANAGGSAARALARMHARHGIAPP